jgi:hypothetical protein
MSLTKESFIPALAVCPAPNPGAPPTVALLVVDRISDGGVPVPGTEKHREPVYPSLSVEQVAAATELLDQALALLDAEAAPAVPGAGLAKTNRLLQATYNLNQAHPVVLMGAVIRSIYQDGLLLDAQQVQAPGPTPLGSEVTDAVCDFVDSFEAALEVTETRAARWSAMQMLLANTPQAPPV